MQEYQNTHDFASSKGRVERSRNKTDCHHKSTHALVWAPLTSPRLFWVLWWLMTGLQDWSLAHRDGHISTRTPCPILYSEALISPGELKMKEADTSVVQRFIRCLTDMIHHKIFSILPSIVSRTAFMFALAGLAMMLSC